MSHIKETQQRGFAALELLLVVVVIAAVAGAGYYVWKQRRADSSNNLATQTSHSAAAPSGTTAAIQQLLDKAAQNEQNVDTKGVTNVANTAKSTDTSATAIGESYNENSY